MQMKLLPQRFSRALPILVATILFLFLVTVSRLRNGSFLPSIGSDNAAPVAAFPPQKKQRPPPTRLPVTPAQCLPEIDYLRGLDVGLSDNILYSRRCVKPIASDTYDRSTVANVSRPLIAHTTEVNLTDCSVAGPVPCEPLDLQVSFPYPPKQYQHLVFGVASTYKRMIDSLPAFGHWLSNSGALIVGVVVDGETGGQDGQPLDLTALERLYAAADVKASFIAPTLKNDPRSGQPDTRTEHHHFMLIRDLLAVSDNETRWLGVLDDDTFFPSLYRMDQELDRYDHTRSLWLGALSDNFDSVKNWGYMAYGGAGVFLSLPLARELEPHLERCINESTIDTGDGILRDCVYAHTHTKLTLVPGLYQHDTHGDMSGFFESGVRPLTVHHWKSWYHEPMPQIAAVSGLCGDCFLGRWRFGNDTVFVNGYSISQYSDGVLDTLDLDRMEGTWNFPGPEYDFSFAPLRERVDKSQKKSYHLRTVQLSETGVFKQIYVYRGDDELEEDDEVIELVWEPE